MKPKKSSRAGRGHTKKKVFLTVIAVIEAKRGCESRVKQALLGLIPATREEKGCVDYELHVQKNRKGSFLFYENWLTKSHLDKHLAMPHLKAFGEATQGLLAKPVSISLWRRFA
ncbi:MAG: antibiotic biosynthesis monooxygenase [Candidatus Omnitrophica bacterium]|nr:antibiotic biosynthesis monooxygenase [Candidatus Omnitrophota bacterium]